jgi:hypothetical protein
MSTRPSSSAFAAQEGIAERMRRFHAMPSIGNDKHTASGHNAAARLAEQG